MNRATQAGVAASLVAIAALGVLAWRASHNVVEVGFWFDLEPHHLPTYVVDALGEPATAGELATVEQFARAELDHAFEGLRLSFNDRRDSFWKIEVLNDLVVNTESPYVGRPSGMAESFMGGPLGGRATISFSRAAQLAVALAPPGASRGDLLAGIGRGIGRAAAHELVHLITRLNLHDRDDPESYEYPFADRAAQFYGELHWGRSWPLLVAQLGE